MPSIKIPYHKSFLPLLLKDEEVNAVLVSRAHEYKASKSETELIADALKAPIGSEKLSLLVKNKNNILIITSDHTRPVPSHLTLPALLKEIRAGNPTANIKILVATGFHRLTTKEEMESKFGSR